MTSNKFYIDPNRFVYFTEFDNSERLFSVPVEPDGTFNLCDAQEVLQSNLRTEEIKLKLR